MSLGFSPTLLLTKVTYVLRIKKAIELQRQSALLINKQKSLGNKYFEEFRYVLLSIYCLWHTSTNSYQVFAVKRDGYVRGILGLIVAECLLCIYMFVWGSSSKSQFCGWPCVQRDIASFSLACWQFLIWGLADACSVWLVVILVLSQD